MTVLIAILLILATLGVIIAAVVLTVIKERDFLHILVSFDHKKELMGFLEPEPILE